MRHNHNARRLVLTLMQSNGQIGKPFTQPNAIHKVFEASQGHFAKALKHFKEKVGSIPGRVFKDKVLGGVRTMQSCGR